MTVYIASLYRPSPLTPRLKPTSNAASFLPYTISFARSDTAQPPPPKPLPKEQVPETVPATPKPAVSLFEKQDDTPSVGPTPGATTDHERIFTADLKKTDKHQSEYPFPNQGTTHNYGHMTESEANSPVWGAKTTLNQPKPRSAFSASPSILRHQDTSAPPTDTLPKVDGPVSQLPNKHLRRLSRAHHRRPSFLETDWHITHADQGNGGLRNAVRAAAESGQLEDRVWVGTLGMPTDALNESTKADISERLEGSYDCMPVDVHDSDFDGHYTHFCKTILWPVFHYQIPDNPKNKAYENHSWVYYVKINQLFAERIARNWRRGDTVWVQDYHLLLVPAMLRKLVPDAQIGFFLHVAFPSSEVFRCLAPRKELLEGMLGANLIGFQTEEYCRHFLQTCSRILSVEATNDGLQLEDRFVNVTKFPIGIDPLSWDQRRKAADVEEWIKTIADRYAGKRLIVGRDKIDSVRGIRQKLLSYEIFLRTHPEWRDKVVLIQVANPSMEQPELEGQISDLVMRINSTHSTLEHQPLVFLKQELDFSQYLALISVADAMMITSLREGMNLTSHEFVYCQDGKYASQGRYGSLILSEFTGSASVFGNHALLVNPWDYHKCAEAIHTALTRNEEERQQVWERLHEAVLQNSTSNWVKSFSETLTRVWHEQSSREIMAVPRLPMNKLEERYKQAGRRLIVLDYEGTLASWGSPRSIIVTTPQRAIITLADLTEDPKNVVYVMSARMPEELERLFRMVSGLGLIAENGCFVREPFSETWLQLTNQKKTEAWKTAVQQILKYYQQRAEGSWIEQRHCSLVFHYETAEDHPAACRLASECADHINDACANLGVHVILVDGVLLVEPTNINKASAAELAWRSCLKQADGGRPDFLFVIGDSRDDEPVFRWANMLESAHAVSYAMTVTLGSRSTEARATLTQGVAGVLTSLERLAKTADQGV